ncbi:MAG: permease [Candidatus Zixiibacteriota bacterium]
MNAATVVMIAIALVLLLVAYLQGDNLHILGLKKGGNMLVQVLPLLIAAFLIAGMVQVLVPKELIARWLGPESGLKGILLGSLAGGLTPGGPVVNFPIVASIYKAGAGIGTVVAYVTAWSLVSVVRFPLEVSLISPKFAFIRLACTFFFPPIAGVIAWLLFSKVA